jgi:DNA primase
MLDGDDPDRKAALSIAQTLCSMTSVFIYNLTDGMKPEDFSDSELMSIVRNFFLLNQYSWTSLVSTAPMCQANNPKHSVLAPIK